MYFSDRIDAARQLVGALRPYAARRPLVLAIPRGAVPMGDAIARALGGDLDVVLVRKLRAPFSPEFAVGAIDESGWAYVSGDAAAAGADAAYLEREKRVQLEVLKRRREQYTPWRARFDPAGRIVIVVDDGLATGATMIAALHSARLHRPERLVCAVPVAAQTSLERVAPLADEVVCLYAPDDFDSVGRFYREFPQVSDEEVQAVLRACASPVSPTHP